VTTTGKSYGTLSQNVDFTASTFMWIAVGT
jgi:hypothetical protein